MPKLTIKIVGAVLLAAGVGMAILHYTLEENIFGSWLSLAIAAVLLILGWWLFSRGSATSGKQGSGGK